MSFRIENKYKVELLKLDELYLFFKNNFAKILYPKRMIRSIYFDNNILSSHEDSVEGIVPRKKVRLRNYSKQDIFNVNNRFNFEFKINSIEGRYKEVKKDVNHLKLLNTGYFDSTYGLMYPVVEISYLREYYLIHNQRITLDTQINYNIFNKKKSRLFDSEIILEIKSNNLDNFNFIEEKFSFMKTRFSKYSNAIESLQLI